MRPCPSPRISLLAGWRPPSPRPPSPPSRGSSYCCRCGMPASRSPPTSTTRASSTAWCASHGSRASSPSGAATWPMCSSTSPPRPSTSPSRISTSRSSWGAWTSEPSSGGTSSVTWHLGGPPARPPLVLSTPLTLPEPA